MKKYVVAVAVLVLAAFAAPALAALNPFMDVPMNHWAYDAIGQLAAKGVLSGYPDGTYKGKQPTTRYEMASALARALALSDLSKASKQDVELLKKLVAEFKDELDAMSVKVDELDVRVGAMESRLGGWKITGELRQDLTWVSDNADTDQTAAFSPLGRARLYVHRWFGEDEDIHFMTRIVGQTGRYASGTTDLIFDRYFVEFPVFGGAQMTVGRQVYDAVEAPYFLDSGVNPFSKHMAMGTDSWLYDRALDSIGLKKTFGAGTAWFYVTHSTFDFNGTTAATIPPAPAPTADDFGFWELYLAGQIQFSERFGFDIGIQYLLGDDSANQYSPPPPPGGTGLELSNIYTAFGGLRFNFNENIALKGMYYLQGFGGTRPAGSYTWLQDDAKAWRAVIDVKQDMLKFTSLWLEYDMLDQGFFVPTGARALFNNYDWAGKEIERVVSRLGGTSATAPTVMLNNDLTIWRIAAQQQWNDKIATFEYFANATVGDVRLNADGTRSDGDITQWGVGVAYQYNPSVLFGLSYEQIKFSDEVADGTGRSGRGHDPSQIRFRTQVLF